MGRDTGLKDSCPFVDTTITSLFTTCQIHLYLSPAETGHVGAEPRLEINPSR